MGNWWDINSYRSIINGGAGQGAAAHIIELGANAQSAQWTVREQSQLENEVPHRTIEVLSIWRVNR
jgi:hypothetical protein